MGSSQPVADSYGMMPFDEAGRQQVQGCRGCA
jgi:hypothetical protein